MSHSKDLWNRVARAKNKDMTNLDSSPRTSRTSIIITCYNYAHYLPFAIASALAQTLPAAEIILVDDGSSDNTAQIAAEFGERVRYIYQSNRGLSAARNRGIQSASGEYVGFLDADDLWSPDFLKSLVPLLDREPTLGAVYCGSQFIDALGHRLSQVVTKTFPADRLHDVLVNGAFFPPGAVLVRKSVLEQLGLFDGAMGACDDWDMWLRISAAYSFAGIPQILALYRRHGNNMTRDLARMRESQLNVARKHFGPEDGDPTQWSSDKQRAFASIYLWHSLANYQRNDYPNAFADLKRAFTVCPDISQSLDTFYLLGCANQPPGYVGDLETLHLDENAAWLLESLKKIFSDPAIPTRLWSKQGVCYGMSFFALGILAYRKRSLGQARRWLARAIRIHPALLQNSQWRTTFAKSLLGHRLLSRGLELKRTRSAA